MHLAVDCIAVQRMCIATGIVKTIFRTSKLFALLGRAARLGPMSFESALIFRNPDFVSTRSIEARQPNQIAGAADEFELVSVRLMTLSFFPL